MTTQRDYMRMLAKKYGRENQDTIITQYAKAELRGKVFRKSQTLSPVEYAFKLWHDMMTKGWDK
jgi:hypothetical protein